MKQTKTKNKKHFWLYSNKNQMSLMLMITEENDMLETTFQLIQVI